jgi:hypothetical protein
LSRFCVASRSFRALDSSSAGSSSHA